MTIILLPTFVVCMYFFPGFIPVVQKEVPVCNLYRSEDQEGQTVSTTGIISGYEEHSAGEKISSFHLNDGECYVKVIADGYLGLQNGNRVRVVGKVHCFAGCQINAKSVVTLK